MKVDSTHLFPRKDAQKMLFGCGGILTPDRFGTVLRTIVPEANTIWKRERDKQCRQP